MFTPSIQKTFPSIDVQNKTKYFKKVFFFLALSVSSLTFAQNYVPDPTFGGTGSIITNSNSYNYNNQAPCNVFFVNNKYVFTQRTQLSAFNLDGSVDYTFGTMGYSRIIIPNCATNTISIKSSKIIDNSIFVFGECYNYGLNVYYGFIAKMSTTGVLDTTFGSNGIAQIYVGPVNNDSISEGIVDVVFQNGNYYGIGTTMYNDSNNVGRKNVFVVKLDSNGTLDVTQNPNGLKYITAIDGHEAKSLFVYQGNLLIIGHTTYNSTGSENSLTLTKIDDNGNLITSYGTNGVKRVTLSPLGYRTGEYFDKCRLIGDSLYLIREYFIINNTTRKIQKIQLDNLNQTNLSVILNGTTYDYMIDNDKLYILGCMSNCLPNFNLIRKNLDGTLDTTFNQTGTYSYNFNPIYPQTATTDSATVIVKDSNDGILVGGYTRLYNFTTAPEAGFAMLRIKDETTLSTTEVNSQTFTLSPNPVKDLLTITSSNNNEIMESITLYDTSGKIVYVENNPSSTINIASLEEGLYFVVINMGTAQKHYKIIKTN